jgi:hypothetical protein
MASEEGDRPMSPNACVYLVGAIVLSFGIGVAMNDPSIALMLMGGSIIVTKFIDSFSD